MIPMSTIMLLLGTLVMLSSCSQVAPPHGASQATTQNGASSKNDVPGAQAPAAAGTTGAEAAAQDGVMEVPVKEITNNTPSFQSYAYALTTTPDTGMLFRFAGKDADSVFQTLSLDTATVKGKTENFETKSGNQIFCYRTNTITFCETTIKADGTAKEVLAKDKLKTGTAQLDQIAALKLDESNGMLKFADAAKSQNSVRVFVRDAQARLLYSYMSGVKATTNADGTQTREGDAITCTMPKDAADKNSFASCYFYLDTRTGTVDKVSVASALYRK